jgi:beta-lactamase class A
VALSTIFGIVTLPEDGGHVAITVFVKLSEQNYRRERTIAEIVRSVHEFFVFQRQGAR